ncbi:MAG: hypothetical protein ACJ765_09335 [Chloroflexota bacterium]
MLGWLFRMVVFRFLPRRIVPFLTFIEIARLVWGLRRRRFGVSDPRSSRTSPPPSWPGSPRVR